MKNEIQKNNQFFTARVEKIIPSGQALVRTSNGVVFLPPATCLPGEVVRFTIEKGPKKTQLARNVSILEPSDHRVSPFCSYYQYCGGCDLMHGDETIQERIKNDILKEALTRVGKITEDQIPDIHYKSVQPFHYRNRVQIQARGTKRGFLGRNTHGLAVVESCKITHSSLQSLFQDSEPFDGLIQAIGTDSGVAAVTLETNIPGKREYRGYKWYPDHLDIQVSDRKIRVNAGEFFQSSVPGLELLITALQKSVSQFFGPKSGSKCLELYCGNGILGSWLPESILEITGVDLDSHAGVLYGKRGRGVIQSVNKFLQNTSANSLSDYSLLIADPSRRGLDQEVFLSLKNKPIPLLVLIFCDPVSAGRDIAQLTSLGYKILDLGILDFYPQTSHFETIAVLGDIHRV